MITVKIDLEDEPASLRDTKHVNTLRINGVPMRGSSMLEGVENGVLTCSDKDYVRTYTWYLEELEKPKKPFSKLFSKQFRVKRFESLGETWYEVQEKTWYWPFWDTWTIPRGTGSDAIRYPNLYIANKAVSFYLRKEQPVNTVVNHL